MTLADILGQPHAVATIQRGLARDRLHHALLFHGPDGVGKELAAMGLACALVCTSAPGIGCGRCGACTRATTFAATPPHTSMHPDVLLVELGLYPRETLGASTAEKSNISIEQIRRIVLQRVTFAPHEASARIVIVRRAEELSTGAANALLKTLEEPPPHTRFVLITTTPGDLLATIRSRTQPIRFAPLSDAIVQSILEKKGIVGDRARAAAILAGGSVSTALALADPERSDARAKAVEALRHGTSGTLLDRLELSSSYANSGDDRVRLRHELDALIAMDAADLRARLLADPTTHDEGAIDALVARQAMSASVIESLERNANVPLTLESALLTLPRRGA